MKKILLFTLFPVVAFGQTQRWYEYPDAGSVSGTDEILIYNGSATNNATVSQVTTDANIPDTITIDNAGTADALSANGANCSAGQYPLGVDAAGAVESCTADTDTNLTEEEVEDFVGGMLGGTETRITVTYQDGTGDIDFVVDDDLSNYDNTTSAFITDYTVTEGDVTTHEAALTITESQISDLGTYEEEAQIGTTNVTGNAADNSVLVGTGSNAIGYVTLPDCADEAEVLGYDQGTGAFTCGADAGAGGGMTSWTLAGDSGSSQTITDGNTATIAGDGVGIDTAAGATDTVTISYVAADAESENEGVLDLQDLQGAVTDGQVPNDITITVSESDVTQHEAAISITESQISDFGSYETADADIAKVNEAETITGSWDIGGGSLEIPNGTSLPGTCTVGQQFMDTDATTGQRHYLCESTNTWALQGDGGGGGGGDSWGDVVDADIVPDGDGTRDLGATATRFAETYTDTIDVTEHIQIDPSSSQTYSEGLIYYDDEDKTFNYFNDESDITMNLGRESWIRVYNDTGSTISNGDAVAISGYDATSGLPEITLTDTSSSDLVRFAGLATHDIENASAGYITNFGRVNGLNTSSFTAGVTLYLSGDDGSLTETRPEAPEYVMPVGVTVESHASTGSIFVGATSLHGGNARLAENVWNGVTVENTDIDVSSNGTVITFTLEADGGGDLTLLMDETRQTLDCTPACSVTLTAGTDTSPQLNYIYVPASTDVLTNSTSGFPTEQHVPVATVLAQSAASMQTDEPYKVHAWQDATNDSNSQGRLSLINRWIRQQNATWASGVAVTPSVGASTFDVATSAGVVYQMNRHSFPAFDTSGGDVVYVVNDPDTAYTQVGDLTQAGGVDEDANGVTLGGSATDFYNLVLWGVVSEDDDQSKLMLNLPTEAYGNDNGDQASNDDNNTAVYTIPQEFRGTGFLIARLTVRENGGTYTIENSVDLRGQVPGLQGGQGAFGGSQFADNVFRIQDDGDDTKEIAFEASGITTATTRTITMPDSDLDLANLPTSAEKTVLGNTSGTNTGDQNLADTVAEITDLDDDAATLSLPASTTISAFGATLVDDAAASNARTTLGLGGLATESAVDAGEYTAASIDGDDINSNIAGRSLTLTAGSPDTLDVDAELYTDVEPWTFIGAAIAAGQVSFQRAPHALTLVQLDCVANGATTAADIVVTAYECDGNGDNCATTGLTVEMDANDSEQTDATASNASIDAGDWWGIEIDSLTTASENLFCSVEYTHDD